MRRSNIAILLGLITLILISCGDKYKTPEDIEGTVAWLDAESALPVFPFGTNPIYLYFHSERSPYCRAMIEKVFNRPEIIEYMNKHFTSIIIKPDSLDKVIFAGQEMGKQELLDEFQVEALPSHYIFNRNGELKGVRTGYIKLREFKQLIKYVAEGYIEKQDFGSWLQTDDSDLDTVWGDF